MYTELRIGLSFDAFIKKYRLTHPALQRLATIVRGAGTGRPEPTPESPGLLAISLGLSQNIADDHAMLRQGMVVMTRYTPGVKAARRVVTAAALNSACLLPSASSVYARC